jgi:hypothetical protein
MLQKTTFLLAMAICLPVLAEDPLATPSGFTLGVQGSAYVYREPTLGVELAGSKLGVTASYTRHERSESPFIRFDLRYADGRLKYEGSGTMEAVPDRSAELRMVFGKDYFPKGGQSLTPYVGLGYRMLRNDLRGTTTTGALGYRRTSHYTYLPLGLEMRFRPAPGWILKPTTEFDIFLGGRQESRLSDTGLGFSDASNSQEKGYGYRASLFLEKGRISFGPWLHYWKIRDSDLADIGLGWVGYEPKNWTREIGAELRYRF